MTAPMYAIFDKSTGEILSNYFGPPKTVSDQLSAGLGAAPCDESVTDTTHWVDQSGHKRVIREKAPLEPSVSTDGLTVTLIDLPEGLSVSVMGELAITDEEPLEIEFELPGTYTIELSGLVPYLAQALEVSVE